MYAKPLILVTRVTEDGGAWVARCEHLDIASQGVSAGEAERALADAIGLFLECADSLEVEERLRANGYPHPIG